MNNRKVTRTIYQAFQEDPYPELDKFISRIELNENFALLELRNNIKSAIASLKIHKINFIGKSITEDILNELNEEKQD